MQQLVDDVRLLTNTENSQFVTDNELLYYLNASLGDLDDMMVAKQEDYRLTNVQITITTGNTFPLPADFYQLRGVDYYNFENQPNPWLTMKSFSLQERNRYANPLLRTMYGVLGLYYMLQDGYVAVIPPDTAAGTYRLWYTPMLSTYALTDTIPSYFSNQAWTEYAVTDSAIKVLNKQNLDPSGFIDQKERLKVRIQAMAGHRDAGAPKHRINTRDTYEGPLLEWWF